VQKIQDCGPTFIDFTPCDFYFLGSLRDKVYKTNPHALRELNNNIRQKVSAISREELLGVKKRVQHVH
jgi:hypothetical protein